MALLVELVGYLGVVVHGLVIAAQSIALGSVFFLLFLARPLAGDLGFEGPELAARVARVAAWSALALLGVQALNLSLELALLTETAGIGLGRAIGAGFALAGLAKVGCAALLALLLFGRGSAAPAPALLALSAATLAAATATTHAAGRLGDRGSLLILEGIHQFGAALWIGGIPVFLLALNRLREGHSWSVVGARFSRLSMLGVASLLASGALMSLAYVGDPEGAYGTAFGVMVGAKVALFGMLMLLGFGNFLTVERLRRAPAAPALRLRRFAEVEIGIGLTVFFAAASLTSVPPSVDLAGDRVSWAEIVERNHPRLPRFSSPDHDALAISALQADLDRDAATRGVRAEAASIPGSGDLPPRNAADIAWSEYNHHWAGFFLVAIGLLALLGQAGARGARHWPLLFGGLGAFLLLRADPDAWPLGPQGFWESLRDVETLQHRTFILLIFAFAFFEWRVRVGDVRRGWAPLVFPVICAAGGALLLTHQHAITNVKDQLLIELSHTPLALIGIVAGWARWLELRLDPGSDGRLRRIAAWTWPVCLLGVGAILVLYRET